MDSRSSAALLDDPRGGLEALQERADVRFDHLAKAADHTAEQIQDKTVAFGGAPLPDRSSIVVFGSWARAELTDESDDDWALLVAREFDPMDADIAGGGHR